MIPSTECMSSKCRRKNLQPTYSCSYSGSSPAVSCSRFRRPRWCSSRTRRWRAPHRALQAKSPTTAAGLAFLVGWHTLRVVANTPGEVGKAKKDLVRPEFRQYLVETQLYTKANCRRAGSSRQGGSRKPLFPANIRRDSYSRGIHAARP